MEPKTYIVLKNVAVNGKHYVEGDAFTASLTRSVESEGINRQLYRPATPEEIEKLNGTTEKKAKK